MQDFIIFLLKNSGHIRKILIIFLYKLSVVSVISQ